MTQPDLTQAGGPVARDRVSGAAKPEPEFVGELRDTELTISFWRRKAAEFGGLPPSTAFDLSRVAGGAWSHRFVICASLRNIHLHLPVALKIHDRAFRSVDGLGRW